METDRGGADIKCPDAVVPRRGNKASGCAGLAARGIAAPGKAGPRHRLPFAGNKLPHVVAYRVAADRERAALGGHHHLHHADIGARVRIPRGAFIVDLAVARRDDHIVVLVKKRGVKP